jgi:hypothetical protein
MDRSSPPRVLIAYESMFGATRQVAEAIADGVRGSAEADCRDVRRVSPFELRRFDLIVVGAPTHARTLPTPASRAEAAMWVDGRMYGARLEDRALAPGLREWIDSTALSGLNVTTFTTRVDMSRLLSGSALPGIARRLRRAGARVDRRGYEALVDEHGQLCDGEVDRARGWGGILGRSLQRDARV